MTVRTECPRCGQDLRGIPASWTDACPIAGRCPECGLEFAWSDILRGRFDVPSWCVEGARGVLDWFQRAPATGLVAAVRPRRLLRELRLEHAPRIYRILPLLVIPALLVPVLLWVSLAQSYVAFGVPRIDALRSALRPWDRSPIVVSAPIPGGGELIAVMRPGGAIALERRDWVGPTSTEANVTPKPDGSVTIPHGAMMVRSADGPMIAVRPSTAWTAVEGPPTGRDRFVRRRMIRGLRGLPVVRAQPGPVNLEGSIGWSPMQVPAEVTASISAADLAAARMATTVTFVAPPPAVMIRGRTVADLRAIPILLAPMLLPIPLAAAACLAVPITLRAARVRRGQLVRLAIYAALTASQLGVMLTVAIAFVGRLGAIRRIAWLSLDGGLVRAIGGTPTMAEATVVSVGVLLVPMIPAICWWTWAARHYLRMPRPLAFGVVTGSVGALSALVILQICFGIVA